MSSHWSEDKENTAGQTEIEREKLTDNGPVMHAMFQLQTLLPYVKFTL